MPYGMTPDIARILAESYREDPNHEKIIEYAGQRGNSVSSIQRACRWYLEYEELFFGARGLTLGEDDIDPLVEPVPIAYGGAARLTDIEHIDPDTDQMEFLAWLGSHARQQDRLLVAHMADVHYPFQDKEAVALALKVYEETQPDVIVVGSDAMDFHLISHFGSDPDAGGAAEDILDQMESYWNPMVYDIKQAAPNARLIFIYGNHEFRLIRFLLENAPKLRRTVLRRFQEIVRAQGRVWWLGETDYVRIGPLVVMHGNRYGVNAAKNSLQDVAYQVSVMMGHGHDLNQYGVRGEDYSVTAVMSGCLCQLKPHYYRAKRMRKKWRHGTALADITLSNRNSTIYNLEFFKDSQGMYVDLIGRRIRDDG